MVSRTDRINSFVGRRNDILAVRQLFSVSRLVTLTGPGGVGKTRLARQLAEEMERAFTDGIFVVELSSLKDPDLLPHTVMDALEIVERRADHSPLAVVRDHLVDRHLLLVLDCCERMVDATAAFVDDVLRAAPGVSVLVTSRQALLTTGEHLYPVVPLAAPDPADHLQQGASAHYPSVKLFAERAAAVVPGFEVTPENEAAVVRLCHRLEGIPLAIELASVRLRVLSVHELADRLDNRFQVLRGGSRDFAERHRTLQSLIDWSYDLCTPTEQLLWSRASAFADGFDIEAVESVCTDDELPADTVLDTVAALVDKSVLVRSEQGRQIRFRMLDTLSEYGGLRLAERAEEDVIARRHRDWYAALLHQAEQEWAGPAQSEWARRLQVEHANLRHALEYCVSTPGEGRIGLTMASVPWFWGAMNHLDEAGLWLDRVLALDTEPSHERAWALATRAYVAGFQGHLTSQLSLADEAHTMGVGLHDAPAVAFANHVRAFCLAVGNRAEAEKAVKVFRTALAQYEQTDVPGQYADSLQVELAATCLIVDRHDEAAAIADDLERRCRARGERWNLSYALWLRGVLEIIGGDPVAAEASLFEALRIKREFRDILGRALILEAVSWAAAAQGEAERAATLLGGTDKLWQGIGRAQLQGLRRPFQTRALKDIGEKRYARAHERGALLSPEQLIALGLRRTASPQRQSHDTHPLTPRELEVARLVAEGMTNREIAERLVISLRTAEGHVERILTKLGFRTRIQIAGWILHGGSAER